MHEALSDLEEVTVRLIWCEINIEYERIIWTNFLSFWLYFKWIRHELSSRFVENWEKCPVYKDWESEFIF